MIADSYLPINISLRNLAIYYFKFMNYYSKIKLLFVLVLLPFAIIFKLKSIPNNSILF